MAIKAESNFKKSVVKDFTNTTFFKFHLPIDKQFAYLFSDPMAKTVFWVVHPSRRIICDPECRIYPKKLLLDNPEVEFVSKQEAHRRRTTHNYSLCCCCACYFPADPSSINLGNQEAIEAANVIVCCTFIYTRITSVTIHRALLDLQENRYENPRYKEKTGKRSRPSKHTLYPYHSVQITWLVCKCLAYNAMRNYGDRTEGALTPSFLAHITGLSFPLVNGYLLRVVNLTPLEFEEACQYLFNRFL